MKRLKRTSLPQKVYNQLLSEIISGQRKAGEKLGEENLSAELKVSRTPVREAIMQLTKEGLAERIPRRGCFVKKLNSAEIYEMFECRQLLECLCLEQGFDNLPQQKLVELGEQINEAASLPPAEQSELSLNVDTMLHQMIADVCPNKKLVEILISLQTQCLPFRTFRSLNEHEIKDATQERKDIIQALLTKDKAKALALLKSHILQIKV